MTLRARRTTASVLLTGMLGMLLTLALAAPASAESIRGDCVGSATFPSKADDTVLSSDRPKSDVFLVPKDETVAYEGALSEGAQPLDSPVPYEGGVQVKLPRYTWSVSHWGGTSDQVAADGTHTYSIPGFVPGGTGEFELTAFHTQGDADCAVVVTIQLDGEPGPAALVAAAGTVVFGAGMLAAGAKKGMKP
ncbi:MAG: hypothetical protein ABFS21_00565 [Actinomycetota bacterium]